MKRKRKVTEKDIWCAIITNLILIGAYSAFYVLLRNNGHGVLYSVLIGVVCLFLFIILLGFSYILYTRIFTEEGRRIERQIREKKEFERWEKRQKYKGLKEAALKGFFIGLGFGTGRSLFGGDK